MIDSVSDTARWVAVYRAMESARPDALFRDPYAGRLAGERGVQMANLLDRGRRAAWAMIVRTFVLDQIILEGVRAGVDLVLNLAAGLDARAWRLDLPETLRWVDVDLPGILDYKTDALRGERTRCRYEAVRLDLRAREERQRLFARLSAEAGRVLIVSEGLLVYLEPVEVAALARDLHAPENFHSWLFDLASPHLLSFMKGSWGRTLRRGKASFQFAPEEGTAFFAPFGWREAQFRSQLEEAGKLHRTMRGMGLLKALLRLFGPGEIRRFAAFVLLERQIAQAGGACYPSPR